MKDPLLKLKILTRTESALLKIQLRRTVNFILIYVVAFLFITISFCMLNFAAYQALAESMGPAMAALLVALADGILTFILIFISQQVGKESEQEMMLRDIRDLALNELNADVDEVKSKVTKVSDDVQNIRTGLSSFNGASSINILGNLSPILNLLIDLLKKGSSK